MELEEALLQPESTSAVPPIAVAVSDLMKLRLEVGLFLFIVRVLNAETDQ
jgi:hypothetical protein